MTGKADSKDTFKQIFRDGWDSFKAKYPRYELVDEVVQKMLGCGEYENGYATYKCPECLEEKIVPFSCKSSFSGVYNKMGGSSARDVA